jgi:hypothetical protein
MSAALAGPVEAKAASDNIVAAAIDLKLKAISEIPPPVDE